MSRMPRYRLIASIIGGRLLNSEMLRLFAITRESSDARPGCHALRVGKIDINRLIAKISKKCLCDKR